MCVKRHIAAVIITAALASSGCIRGSFKLKMNRNSGATQTKTSLANCVDPDAGQIAQGHTFTRCDGTEAVGTYPIDRLCEAEGAVDCVVINDWAVLDTTRIKADEILFGKNVAGITGSRRATRLCRNFGRTNIFDGNAPTNSVTTWEFLPADINTVTDVITLGAAHPFVNDTPVLFSNHNFPPAPITWANIANTYYIIVVSATQIQLATTPGGPAINFTAQGMGNHNLWLTGDGTIQDYETIDDYKIGTVKSEMKAPWSIDYACTTENILDVTSTTAPLKPSGAIPTHGDIAFTAIYQDQLTGLYFTNVFNNGSGVATWAHAYAMCESINSSDAGTGWRLPTQKEIAQLYIDGVGAYTYSGVHREFVTSTSISTSLSQPWDVVFRSGRVNGSQNKQSNQNALICVRE